ncbi:hypothetical protein ACP4OV_030442 [Aristida adscensionis]
MAPLLLPFLLLLSSASVLCQQNITLGSWLTPEGPNSSWLSPSGDFAFGFRPIEGNSSYYLIAVWFNKISDKTVVWYANSIDQVPVTASSSSRLELASDGRLLLHDSTSPQVLNPQVAGVAYASMLNTGNFILAATDGSESWGTFTSPVDTILLTQVLTAMLRSRLMDTDYSGGRFLLNMQTSGVVLRSVAVPSGNPYDSYWSLDGNTTEMVFDKTGRIYIAFSNGTQNNITSTSVGSMADFYHRATLDPDGVFRQYVYPKKPNNLWSQSWTQVGFHPPNICDATTGVGSGTCGFNSYCSFDGNKNRTNCMCPAQYSFIDEVRTYKGCKPDFQPHSCDLDETAAMAQFQLTPLINVDWPLADYEQYSPTTESQCRYLCLIDCFCAVTVFHDSTCWKKKLPLSNGRMGSGVQRTLLIKVPRNNNSQSALSESSKWKHEKKYWILGGSLLLAGSFMANILLISALIFGTFCTINRKKFQSMHSSSNLGLPLKTFTYAELEKATNGFKEVLGTGASSIVYKGQLQDELRTGIAVKRIDKLQQDTDKEFTVEVQTIGRTHHKNLVRLLGFCDEGKESLLVYEFMANGSLDIFLFGNQRLHWNVRVQLALGVARGLLYLHEECSTQIIHCDIKPQNILLDENFTAKISDFGLAKLLRTNETRTNTGIRGTRGYVAPEWFKNMGITAKVDVYSFGVILLELICCRRNVELEAAGEDETILTYWANDCYRCGRTDLLVKDDEEAIFNLKKVERFVAVALWCLQEDPTMRPTMLKVTQMLDGAVAIPTPPDPSSFISSLP